MSTVTILEKQDIPFVPYDNDGLLYMCLVTPSVMSLVEGESYVVEWDGAQYPCDAIAATFNGIDGLVLGNLALAGLGADTEEPFLIGSALDSSSDVCFTTEKDATNQVWIYQEVEDVHAPNDAVILSYSQNPVEYNAVPKVWLTHPDSTEESPVLVPFTYGEASSREVIPDFAAGNMQVPIADGELITELTVVKPDTLDPGNIKAGVIIAGVPGEFRGNAINTTIELDFSEGSMLVVPAEGASFSEVRIPVPDNLIPENIADGVTIAGVGPGIHKGGADFDFEDVNLKFFTYQIDPDTKQIILYSILYSVLYESTGSYDVTIPNQIGGYDVIIAFT